MGTRTARERARQHLTEEILDAARLELVESGAAGLSLRAVARRVDLTPSAIYRYFSGRDALLTELLVEAFRDLTEVVREADTEAAPGPRRRWAAMGHAMRAWAVEHPHSWALIHGSPVPGYRAPAETTAAAVGVVEALIGIVADAARLGGAGPVPGRAYALPELTAGLTQWVARIGEPVLTPLEPATAAAAIYAYTSLLGAISAELFGEFGPDGSPASEMFDYGLGVSADILGLP